MSVNAPPLVLVPTQFEANLLSELSVPAHICGFGLAAAAARTAFLITEAKREGDCPTVVLLGIAGSLDTSCEVGTAARFGRVSCYGIGAGSGSSFLSAQEMGWSHCQDDSGDAISDTIVFNQACPSHLLSVCAAAGNENDVVQRLEKFPTAGAEDMEAFGVALACSLANCELKVYRGISNQAGDRDKSRWKIRAALQATADLFLMDFPENSTPQSKEQ